MTIAEKIARLYEGDRNREATDAAQLQAVMDEEGWTVRDMDGGLIRAEDGIMLGELLLAVQVRMQAGRAVYGEGANADVLEGYEIVPSSEAHGGHAYRYVFSDGSAIVIEGSAWDIEGERPFTFRG